MRIVFMGTPDFAVPSLERLVGAGYGPVAVVTGPDRPRRRGHRVRSTPVAEAAHRCGIAPVLRPESVRDPAFARDVEALAPDLIVVVAFRILPSEVYRVASKGAFNLHGSLLPAYRGAAPMHWAIMQGEEETGVTTFFLEDTVDTGAIILQRALPIGPDETAGELYDRMKVLGARVVVETVRQIEQGTVKTRSQNDAGASPAPRIHREDGHIVWDRPARRVHNQIRGLSPRPGAWTHHGKVLLKVYRTRVADPGYAGEPGFLRRRTSRGSVDSGYADEPGMVIEASDRLVVACREGAVELVELQQEGRRSLSAAAFLNGYAIQVGDRLV